MKGKQYGPRGMYRVSRPEAHSRAPPGTLGNAEKVRYQFLSLRQRAQVSSPETSVTDRT
jgi:hypothetical protein